MSGKLFKQGTDKISDRWTEFQITFISNNLDKGGIYDVCYKTLSKISGTSKTLTSNGLKQTWNEPIVFTLHTNEKHDLKIPCSIKLRKQV